MLILVTGATGFIGRHVAAALIARGHSVVGCTRSVSTASARYPALRWLEADLNRDLDAGAWCPRLVGVDAVINCAGILHESPRETFEAVHALGARALFDACARSGVKRVIQFSVAGIHSQARSHFIACKRYADEYLEGLDLDWTVLAAAPVFGPESPFSKVLVALAHLPPLALIDTRGARIAPVHVDDVAAAVAGLVEPEAPVRTRIALVGPHCVSLEEYVARLREALSRSRAREIRLSTRLIALTALAVGLARAGFPTRELLALLRSDLTGNPGPLRELLGRAPRAIESFLTDATADVRLS